MSNFDEDFEEPWESLTEADSACKHGYVRGEHHWYRCMGVDLFKEEKDKINFNLDISHRWYPR